MVTLNGFFKHTLADPKKRIQDREQLNVCSASRPPANEPVDGFTDCPRRVRSSFWLGSPCHIATASASTQPLLPWGCQKRTRRQDGNSLFCFCHDIIWLVALSLSVCCDCLLACLQACLLFFSSQLFSKWNEKLRITLWCHCTARRFRDFWHSTRS